MGDGILSSLLRRDRTVVLSGLVAATTIGWAYLLLGAGMGMSLGQMTGQMGGGMMAMKPPVWTLGYAAIVFVMWAVMMMAMMLPSAAPTILLVATLARRRGQSGGIAAGAAGLFASGYLLVWILFSLIATSVQWALSQAGVLSPMMATSDRVVAAAVLIAAGIYQWTPWKDSCLRNCRSPIGALMQYWRPGGFGAHRAGVMNGLYCLGCCWVLMALLFVGGVMNLIWIAAITLLVLVEKTLPGGGWTARIVGAALALWGALALIPAIG